MFNFFASTQRETENIHRTLYHQWMQQILYNHHQSGPAGTVVWSSPQRDPYNYNLDPLLILGQGLAQTAFDLLDDLLAFGHQHLLEHFLTALPRLSLFRGFFGTD